MKVVCHAEQKAHYPLHFLVNGVFQPNPEQPELPVVRQLRRPGARTPCRPRRAARAELRVEPWLVASVSSPIVRRGRGGAANPCPP